MADVVVCIGCALPYREQEASNSDFPEAVCRCPPPQHQAERVGCPSCGGSLKVGARACPYCRCTLATARCEHCTAWNLAASEFCRSCGKLLGTVQDGDRDALGSCPRCHGALQARLYADLDVDECDACGGIFLEQPVLERMIRSRAQIAPLHLALPKRERHVERGVQYIGCPVCERLMNRQIFGRISGVIVDTCKPHGVWFDAGELSAIIEFVERGGLAESRLRESRDAEREKRERARLAAIPWDAPQQGSSLTGSSGSFFISAIEALLS